MRGLKIFDSAKKTIHCALAALAAGGMLFASGGTAQADQSQADKAFIAVLEVYSVPYPNESVAEAEAHEACSVLDRTENLGTAGIDVMTTFPDLSMSQAAKFLGAAVGAYCPQHSNLYQGEGS